jgi:hypothetical protein
MHINIVKYIANLPNVKHIRGIGAGHTGFATNGPRAI